MLMKRLFFFLVLMLVTSVAWFTGCKKVKLPVVETVGVSDVTVTGCIVGGTVVTDGGGDIVERGVCWSKGDLPTINGEHLHTTGGLGAFSCSVTGLEPATEYTVRAYASNEAGVAYGDAVRFTTLPDGGDEPEGLPQVYTVGVNVLSWTSVTGSGIVTKPGGSDILECGVCWSTEPNPTIDGDHQASPVTGSTAFYCTINDLLPYEEYYLRAYAVNRTGVGYGEQCNFRMEFLIAGALDGLFSVSLAQRVHFSQGNLQYRASSNEWRFAENQWDYVGSQSPSVGDPGGSVPGSDNLGVSSTYDGWIDLFGWNTSGYESIAGDHYPWACNADGTFYYAYDEPYANLYDHDGTADWGYNPIVNGGNQFQLGWRTLSIEEWDYVINTRNTVSGIRYAKACVNGVNGLVLLPDDWDASCYPFDHPNEGAASFSSNSIAASQWETLECLGAVFMPAAGFRNCSINVHVQYPGALGRYWSSSTGSSKNAKDVFFEDSQLALDDDNKALGFSVRLVIFLQYVQ